MATYGMKLPIPISGLKLAELEKAVGIESAMHLQAAGINLDLGDQED